MTVHLHRTVLQQTFALTWDKFQMLFKIPKNRKIQKNKNKIPNNNNNNNKQEMSLLPPQKKNKINGTQISQFSTESPTNPQHLGRQVTRVAGAFTLASIHLAWRLHRVDQLLIGFDVGPMVFIGVQLGILGDNLPINTHLGCANRDEQMSSQDDHFPY